MEWWTHFLDLLTHNTYFRAGFLWGIALAAISWILYGLGYRLYVQWLKMRQFFEPIKKPSKPPVETGPSPASIMLGCIGRILITALIVGTVIVVFAWLTRSPGV